MRYCAIAALIFLPTFTAEYYAQNTDTMDNSPPSATSNTIESGSANPLANNANGHLSGNKDMPPIRSTSSHLAGRSDSPSSGETAPVTPASPDAAH